MQDRINGKTSSAVYLHTQDTMFKVQIRDSLRLFLESDYFVLWIHASPPDNSLGAWHVNYVPATGTVVLFYS